MEIGLNTIYNEDCLTFLKELPDETISSVVTDPPYGLSKDDPAKIQKVIQMWAEGKDEVIIKGKGFMGKEWDAFVPPPVVWKEVYRVLKPGGYALVFAGTRTQDLMTLSLRFAGFEVRDVIEWLYFSGFPKSMNVGKVVEARQLLAKQYDGFGTALKPAHEPIILVRKPLDGTVADNMMKHGTGGINIDACRIGDEEISTHNAPKGTFAGGEWDRGSETVYRKHQGRFPANCITLEEDQFYSKYFNITPEEQSKKASKKDRNSDFSGEEIDIKNNHPTVKSIDLMTWLIKLITPCDGVLLDPFAGSGSTLVAAKRLQTKDQKYSDLKFIGCELQREYYEIAMKRIDEKPEEIEEEAERAEEAENE